MLPQNHVAEGVYGADDSFVDVGPVVRQFRAGEQLATHPLPHLHGSRVGEGDSGNLRDPVFLEQRHIALHQHTSLAAASARSDQHVAATFGDDGGLFGRQSQRFHRLNWFTLQM